MPALDTHKILSKEGSQIRCNRIKFLRGDKLDPPRGKHQNQNNPSTRTGSTPHPCNKLPDRERWWRIWLVVLPKVHFVCRCRYMDVSSRDDPTTPPSSLVSVPSLDLWVSCKTIIGSGHVTTCLSLFQPVSLAVKKSDLNNRSCSQKMF